MSRVVVLPKPLPACSRVKLGELSTRIDIKDIECGDLVEINTKSLAHNSKKWLCLVSGVNIDDDLNNGLILGHFVDGCNLDRESMIDFINFDEIKNVVVFAKQADKLFALIQDLASDLRKNLANGLLCG